MPYKDPLTPEQREAARKGMKEVGLPVRCMGCRTDYRTNLLACPGCGREREYVPVEKETGDTSDAAQPQLFGGGLR